MEVENKPSNYHPVRLQVKNFSAFCKTGFVRNQTERKIKVENSVSIITDNLGSYESYKFRKDILPKETTRYQL